MRIIITLLCFLFVSLKLLGCAHPGPVMTVCIVDEAKKGFDCFKAPKTKSFFLFELRKDLLCASGEQTEIYVKQCGEGILFPMTLCSYVGPELNHEFLCTPPNSILPPYNQSIHETENWVCLSKLDKRRSDERCSKPKKII